MIAVKPAATKRPEKFNRVNKSQKPTLSVPYFKLIIAAFCLAVITYITFTSAINNRIVMWDNESYLYNNPLVTSPSTTLEDIFTKPSVGNYAPLAIWSLRRDYKSNGLVAVPVEAAEQATSNNQMKLGNMPLYDGTGYNLTNIRIHILNVIVVFLFWFFLRNGKELAEAFLVALLFSIHPMHVETVAWIADRKDQLCALFYFASLLSYVISKRKTSKWWDGFTLLFFVMALLCKATAVTLPVVLILIDLFFFRQEHQKINWKVVSSKWIFFVLALVFGLVTVITQKNAKAIDAAPYPLSEHFSFGFYALLNYLFRWIMPLPAYLSSYYPYPEKISGGYYPWIIYASPVIAMALAVLLVWKFRTNKLIMFCGLFFLVNIVLLLQFISVGDVILADRYSYISYVGLFGLTAILINSCWKKYSVKGTLPRFFMLLVFGSYFIFLGFTSYERNKVWFDNKTLWRDVKEKYPRHYLADSQIGISYEYENGGNIDSAMVYLTRSIAIKPNPDTYMNRANIYAARSDFNSAISDLTNAIRLNSEHVMARGHRGLVYAMAGKMDSASVDFNEMIRMNPPGLSDACVQFGRAYNLHGMPDSAMVMFNKALAANPDNSDAYAELSKIKPADNSQNNLSSMGIIYKGKIKGTGKIIQK